MLTTRTRQLLLLPTLALLTAAGCKSSRNHCDSCPQPPPPGGQIVVPGPAMQGPPPGATIVQPGGTTLLPPAPPPPGAPQVSAPPPPSFPPVASFYGIQPGVRLSPPDAVIQAQAAAPAPTQPINPPSIKLLPPEFSNAAAAAPPVAENAPKPSTPAPPLAPMTPSLPVGIVDFAPALQDRVAAGRKPSLEGLDWLKANGYKSAVQIRRPGESDAADRKQVEARGLKFTSIEVSPATLSWATADTFAKLVGDSAAQPTFVYDADGSLSGGLWYLYFRRVERLPDEAARLRAARLGLKDGADGSYREMWLAVQKLLSTNSV
jgi:protein tyrosine phosphatase (PTP) superfamily phosphohydrolase (DUF442 family)